MADDSTLRARQAGSFGAAADVYERSRPGYPEAALDWLLPEDAKVVLDLGAGTGKLTRQLAARGLEVIAVEPSDGMRAQLQAVLPDVRALAGAAEQIPLPDASVDAVLAAQAWHWVDVKRAVPEVARILRPRGRLGLVWNTRDERVDWIAQLGALLAGGVTHMDTANPVVGRPFGPIERHDIEWSNPLTPAGIVDLAASRSYVITATDAERDAKLGAIRRLLETHPDTAGRERIELRYVARCSRAQLA